MYEWSQLGAGAHRVFDAVDGVNEYQLPSAQIIKQHVFLNGDVLLCLNRSTRRLAMQAMLARL